LNGSHDRQGFDGGSQLTEWLPRVAHQHQDKGTSKAVVFNVIGISSHSPE